MHDEDIETLNISDFLKTVVNQHNTKSTILIILSADFSVIKYIYIFIQRLSLSISRTFSSSQTEMPYTWNTSSPFLTLSNYLKQWEEIEKSYRRMWIWEPLPMFSFLPKWKRLAFLKVPKKNPFETINNKSFLRRNNAIVIEQ